ncbi:unnamed protein product, partial [marine sediment metagenome]
DKFTKGAYVRVIDDEIGEDFIARIINVTKSDITEEPGNVQLEIGNKVRDLTTYNAEIKRKQLINDLYSQGAVNIDSNDYQDNCDDSHPAKVSFYLPAETVNVNECRLTFNTEAFRAYETGSAANGDHRHKMFSYMGTMSKSVMEVEIMAVTVAVS